MGIAASQISTELTYAEITAAIASNSLTIGAIYKITDRGDRGLFFQALASNRLSHRGTRLMLCPARYSNSEVDANGNSWKGVWNNAKTAAVNDLMIWGGKVWKNLTGAIGNSLNETSLDATNWVLIPKTSFSNNEYVELEFGVQYDVTNDWIEKQWDSSGNVFGLDYLSQDWWWGDYSVNFCDISDWNYSANNDDIVMFNNITMAVWNNSCQSIYSNKNNWGVGNNSNSGEIHSNANSREITYNKCTGDINNNTNNGTIFDNINSGGISYNRNNGDIKNNGNNGSISYNNNNGDIFFLDNNNTNVTYNTNNGYVAPLGTGEISDTVVNKG